VRQVEALDEVAEALLELGPVGDEHGFVHGATLGESHKGGHRGSDGLDRPGTRGNLLHVHTGREVTAGHLGVSLVAGERLRRRTQWFGGRG
jgi:hypothetical protein